MGSVYHLTTLWTFSTLAVQLAMSWSDKSQAKPPGAAPLKEYAGGGHADNEEHHEGHYGKTPSTHRYLRGGHVVPGRTQQLVKHPDSKCASGRASF